MFKYSKIKLKIYPHAVTQCSNLIFRTVKRLLFYGKQASFFLKATYFNCSYCIMLLLAKPMQTNHHSTDPRHYVTVYFIWQENWQKWLITPVPGSWHLPFSLPETCFPYFWINFTMFRSWFLMSSLTRSSLTTVLNITIPYPSAQSLFCCLTLQFSLQIISFDMYICFIHFIFCFHPVTRWQKTTYFSLLHQQCLKHNLPKGRTSADIC